MECKKFVQLLEDMESSRYNVGRIEILKCYVAQRFSSEQITKLIKPMTRSKAKIQGFQLLVEEMHVCNLKEAVSLINEISANTVDTGNRFSCLEELVKNKKMNLKEGEHFSLFALFQGTTSEETAAKLLNITLQNPYAKVSLFSTAAPIPSPLCGPPTPLSRPPTPLSRPPTPLSRPPTPLSRPPTPLNRPPTPLNQPPTPLNQPPIPYLSISHNSIGTSASNLPNMTNCVCENAINPTTIGFVLPQEAPYPSPLLHGAITQGPPPEVGFNIQL